MMEKNVQEQTVFPVDSHGPQSVELQKGSHLHRGLKARHITMVSICALCATTLG
jgi:amino acid permease